MATVTDDRSKGDPRTGAMSHKQSWLRTPDRMPLVTMLADASYESTECEHTVPPFAFVKKAEVFRDRV